MANVKMQLGMTVAMRNLAGVVDLWSIYSLRKGEVILIRSGRPPQQVARELVQVKVNAQYGEFTPEELEGIRDQIAMGVRSIADVTAELERGNCHRKIRQLIG